MPLQRTILLDYDLILTGIRTRRSLHCDNVSILSTIGCDLQENVIAAGQQQNFTNITEVFFLRCDNPLLAIINSGNAFTINSLFINFGPINSLLLDNTGSVDVNCVSVIV